jgi:hypothetical protein
VALRINSINLEKSLEIKNPIVGGCGNTTYGSTGSSLLGGCLNSSTQSQQVAIIGGYQNKIESSLYSGIFLSKGAEITNSENSIILTGEFYSGTPYCGKSGGNQIIGGKNNLVTGGFYFNNGNTYNFPNRAYNSFSSTILGGRANILGTSSDSSIIGGRCNTLSYYTTYSSIVGGFLNTLYCRSYNSSIVGGRNNNLAHYSHYSSIIGGKYNIISTFSRYSSVIGGQYNDLSCNSCNSVILGGHCNNITTYSCYSSIVGGKYNSIFCSRNSSISSSLSSCINFGSYITIVGGAQHQIGENYYYSSNSSIFGGSQNSIKTTGDSTSTSIVSGINNCIRGYGAISTVIVGGSSNVLSTYGGRYNSILGGSSNKICGPGSLTNLYYAINSTIVGGYKNLICLAKNSSIISGEYNELRSDYQKLQNSVIVGGDSNKITETTDVFKYNSAILGGKDNQILNSSNSTILGGIGLTLSNESEVAYVPKLKIATASNDDSVNKILVWDSVDNYVKYRNESSLSGGSGTSNTSLPIPKINLMPSSVQIDVWDKSTNGVHATQALVFGYPILVNMDFTSDHFSDPNNRIFIEMVHYRRKNRSRKNGGNIHKGSSYVIPSKQIANVGQDTNLPWLSSGGFWNRGGNHTIYDSIGSTSSIIGIDRPNHYEINGYTMSTYNVYEYLTGRFEYFNVMYSDTTGTDNSIFTLIPSQGKSRGGKNKPTSRFAYSSYLTPYYFSFRYIQWLPNANGGLGQIISGPLSKTLKITPYYFPFNTDYVLSQQFGYPVSSIDTNFISGDGYYKLKCNWETNLP